MVDKGVGKVQQPDFLFKGNQMSAHDVLEIQSIACLGDHAERLIRTAKENKLFDTEIPLYISGSYSLWHVSSPISRMDLWSKSGE